MKQVNFQSGQKLTKQVFTHLEESKKEAILERFSDIFTGGVVKNLLNEMDIIDGTNTLPASPTVTVRTGLAYRADGERVLVEEEATTFDATRPTTTTANGLGGFTLTPLSTGSLNILLVADTTNFIWIDYLETTDSSAFTLHKVTSEKLFYKKQDGYKLAANLSGVTPPGGFSSSALVIGSIITDSALGSGISSILTTVRTDFGTQAERVRTKIPEANRSDATTTYASGSTVFMDDHVKAVGNGTVGPTNPHGLTSEDLGITDPGGTTHQRSLHVDGIVSSSITGNASALFMQEHTSGVASQNFVEVFPLVTDELATVDGVTFTPTDIPSAVQFFFVDGGGSPLPDGTYTIYLDSSDRQVKIAQPGAFNPADVTLRRIWEIDWVSPSLVALSKTDRRVFGNISNNNLRFELLGGLINGLATGNRGTIFAYDAGNDDRIISATVSGDNGDISGTDTVITYAYDAPAPAGKLVSVSATYGNRTLTTTISYSGDLVDTVTESIV